MTRSKWYWYPTPIPPPLLSVRTRPSRYFPCELSLWNRSAISRIDCLCLSSSSFWSVPNWDHCLLSKPSYALEDRSDFPWKYSLPNRLFFPTPPDCHFLLCHSSCFIALTEIWAFSKTPISKLILPHGFSVAKTFTCVPSILMLRRCLRHQGPFAVATQTYTQTLTRRSSLFWVKHKRKLVYLCFQKQKSLFTNVVPTSCITFYVCVTKCKKVSIVSALLLRTFIVPVLSPLRVIPLPHPHICSSLCLHPTGCGAASCVKGASMGKRYFYGYSKMKIEFL